MIIKTNGILFVLDPNDEQFGTIHARMIQEFQEEAKLDFFKQLLQQDVNTAFELYNLNNSNNETNI